eukprot:TRINITY_DN429_c0_g1_i18.p2 TRINITY_DN429_c0_g1~~TRINITY_DN429_c0_g1_i18.p2  ORF type:complete len:271 (+),score=34.11 TRINITY_DN429_c0_g1_i18:149-961(+)
MPAITRAYLEGKSVKDLKVLAADNDIPLRGKKRKADIVDELLTDLENTSVPSDDGDSESDAALGRVEAESAHRADEEQADAEAPRAEKKARIGAPSARFVTDAPLEEEELLDVTNWLPDPWGAYGQFKAVWADRIRSYDGREAVAAALRTIRRMVPKIADPTAQTEIEAQLMLIVERQQPKRVVAAVRRKERIKRMPPTFRAFFEACETEKERQRKEARKSESRGRSQSREHFRNRGGAPTRSNSAYGSGKKGGRGGGGKFGRRGGKGRY